MTTLARQITLVLNGDLPGGANAVLSDLTSGRAAGSRLRWMQGDACPHYVYFRKPAAAIGAAAEIYELAAGYTLVAGAKVHIANYPATSLFEILSFARTVIGDDVCYVGMIDLNTDAIDDALETHATVDVDIDYEYRDALNTVRLSYRAEITIVRQAYEGTAPTQTYLISSTPGLFVFRISASDAGQLQITREAYQAIAPPTTYRLTSTGGYVFELFVTDDGLPQIERV